MKRTKKIIILLSILAAACVVALIIHFVKQEKEAIKNEEKVILEITAEDVINLSWENTTEDLAFHRSGDEVWLYDEDEKFPVDEDKILSLLSVFEEFSSTFTIDDPENLGQYGLDDPECVIYITEGDTEYVVSLGDYSSMDRQRYVSIGDGKVYLAAEDPMASFQVELKDMIKDDDLPSFIETSSIKFEGANGYDVYEETGGTLSICADDIYFTDLNNKTRPLDTSKTESYLDLITYLDQSEYVTYDAGTDDLDYYGISKPELHITAAYSDEAAGEDEKNWETFEIFIGLSEADRALMESEEQDADDSYSAYVRINNSSIIYAITAADFKALMEYSYDCLRHDEIFTADFSEVTKFTVNIDGGDYEITAEKQDGDEDAVYKYKDEEIEIDDFKSALTSVTVSSFTSAAEKDKKEISVVCELDNPNFKKLEISFYRVDGEKCLAVVDGETVGYVDRSYVVDLMESVNAIVL